MDKGVIYLLTCKPNGKKYVGQAVNFTGRINRPWGMEGRWKSHVKEALEGSKDHCRLLNNAIRKYGADAFERTVLCECKIEELDEMEENFMHEHNVFEPNGYNLKRGGTRGKWSEESKRLKSEAMKGTTHTEEAKIKMSVNQIGNRRETKVRKNEEDKDLPKYINAIRHDGKVLGYMVKGFPVGVTEKKYICKSFQNRNDPQKAYTSAVMFLDKLKAEYEANVQAAIEARKKEAAREAIVQQTLARSDDDYIKPIPCPENPNKHLGYVVNGLVDDKGNPIPEKRFDDTNNYHALNRAKKYVKQVQMLLQNNAVVADWSKVDTIYKCDKKGVETENLPKYINVCSYKGEKAGYVVNGYPLPNGKKSCKKFTNRFRYTMEQLYENAIKYLDELKTQYPIAK
jgi:group I intron endonuclease